MSNCLNNYIRVRFERNDTVKIGDLELVRPEVWSEKDEQGNAKYEDDGTQKMGYNTNGLETKPQLCEVLIANDNYPYKAGDKLFVHYMAEEVAVDGDLVTREAFILAEYVFFTILPNGEWKCADGIYIGEPVLNGEEVSPNGIFVSLGKKDNLKVKISHVPKDNDVQIGETVVSVDRYNYQFELDGKEWIMIRESEIAGRVVEV